MKKKIKFSKTTIVKLKSIPIEQVCKKLGITFDHEKKGICPFHEGSDKPTFFIFSHRNSFQCFECFASGDVIKMVQLHLKLDMKSAMKWLIDNFLKEEE